MRELSSPRVDQSVRCPVRELAIRELAYPRVVQLPDRLGLLISFHYYAAPLDAVYCYRQQCGLSVSLSVTTVSSAKMAEPIEIPFGIWTNMGPRNCVLDGVHISTRERAILRAGKGQPRTGDRPRPKPDCVRWGTSSLPPKRAQPPIFDPCSL